jgi:hypothetical protein
MAKEDEYLTVYWAPAILPKTGDPDIDWTGSLGQYPYPNLRTLSSDLMADKNPHRGPSTYLSCPAATDVFKTTAVIYNGIPCEYVYDLSDHQNPRVEPKTDKYLNLKIPRPPALNNKPTVEFQLRWFFFAEEPLVMRVTPPMFHQPKYTKYASAVPGSYDIGRWLRPLVFEIQMWEDRGKLVFEENEPLMYVSFETDKKVKLQRFVTSKELAEHSVHGLVRTWAEGMGLDKRYDVFENSGMREIVLREIRKNIVE